MFLLSFVIAIVLLWSCLNERNNQWSMKRFFVSKYKILQSSKPKKFFWTFEKKSPNIVILHKSWVVLCFELESRSLLEKSRSRKILWVSSVCAYRYLLKIYHYKAYNLLHFRHDFNSLVFSILLKRRHIFQNRFDSWPRRFYIEILKRWGDRNKKRDRTLTNQSNIY